MFTVKLTIFYFIIMIKSILNLEGVQSLSKEVQKEVNGGMLGVSVPSYGSCSTICANPANQGSLCGPHHCPSLCVGVGRSERI